MKKIAVLGIFVMDLMSRSHHLPIKGETVKGSYFQMGPGGKGSNQAVAAARLGADCKLITKIGHDDFGHIAEEFLKKEGLMSEGILYSESMATGAALVMVDENSGQNQIVVYAGPCDDITDDDIASLDNIFAESSILLAQLECNMSANYAAIRRAKANGALVVLNTAPYRPLDDDLLSMVDIVTPNEVEAAGLSGFDTVTVENADAACDAIMKRGVKTVIITLGDKGAYVKGEGFAEHIAPIKVNAIDTTGAGDAFNGAFVKALADGMSVIDAAKFANVAAALSTTKLGTAGAMATEKEVEECLAGLF